MKIETGTNAPNFSTTALTLNPDTNKVETRIWTLSEEIKKGPVLLIFYPGDFTAVCTKQLCDYRDHWGSLKKFPVQIVGISTNDSASHEKFVQANKFPFSLLDDSQKTICTTYDMLMFIGLAARGFVLINKEMRIKYKFKETMPFFKRSASEVAEILEKNL